MYLDMQGEFSIAPMRGYNTSLWLWCKRVVFYTPYAALDDFQDFARDRVISRYSIPRIFVHPCR